MYLFKTLFISLCFSLSLNLIGAEHGPGKQVEMSLDLGDGKSMGYLLYLPTDYGQASEPSPVMLFLHGRGESFGPLSLVKKWGPPRMVERGDDLPYILVSPQCPRDESWSQPGQQAALMALIDHVFATFKGDKNRLYLTGLSMGGYGSWRLAADHPGLFAAVVPICGGGDPKDASSLKDIPIWVFHGTEDTAVPFERSIQMVEAIRRAGGNKIRFTSLEGVGHFSWTAAYALHDLYPWLDKQSLPR